MNGHMHMKREERSGHCHSESCMVPSGRGDTCALGASSAGGTVRHILGYLHQDCLTHDGASPSGLFGDDRGWSRDTDLIQRVIPSASMAVTWQPVSDLRTPHSLKVGKQRGYIGRMLEREHSFVSAGLSWAAP